MGSTTLFQKVQHDGLLIQKVQPVALLQGLANIVKPPPARGKHPQLSQDGIITKVKPPPARGKLN